MARRLVVFGDSYSQINSPTYPFPKWSQHLLNRGFITALSSYAKGGATAVNSGRDDDGLNTWAEQLALAHADGYTPEDVAVVYLGYNDIFKGGSGSYTPLADSITDFDSRLVTTVTRYPKTVIVLPHDRGWNRSDAAEIAARTDEWNDALRNLASEHEVEMLDLFSVMETVRLFPCLYGFSTTTTEDDTVDSGVLYWDSGHVGSRGQRLIGKVMAKLLEGV